MVSPYLNISSQRVHIYEQYTLKHLSTVKSRICSEIIWQGREESLDKTVKLNYSIFISWKPSIMISLALFSSKFPKISDLLDSILCR